MGSGYEEKAREKFFPCHSSGQQQQRREAGEQVDRSDGQLASTGRKGSLENPQVNFAGILRPNVNSLGDFPAATLFADGPWW
jgi:hypothetical protein